MTDTTIEIGFLFFPRMTQLDVTGPFEVLARLPGARTHLLWKRIEPIISDVGLTLMPTTIFGGCPSLDVLCVGGGPGRTAVMDDDEVMDFVARSGATARYVTSVCVGSLILVAAGLLDGYRSACHWMSRDLLPRMGAIPADARVVVYRNRISAAESRPPSTLRSGSRPSCSGRTSPNNCSRCWNTPRKCRSTSSNTTPRLRSSPPCRPRPRRGGMTASAPATGR